MDPDLLDAIGAAVFVALRRANGRLVIEAANASFRAAAGLRDRFPPAPPAESVLPAAWVGAVAEAARSGSALLPPALLAGRNEPVGGVARALGGKPPRVVGTLAGAPAGAAADEAADILDLQSEMVCRWRPDGTVYYCNAAYARACGRPKAEVVGADLAELTPADEMTQILANVRRLGPETPVAAYDHRVPLPDGTEQWQEWIDQALFGPDGRTVVAYQSTGRDITARKLAEERLRRSEQRVLLALAAGEQGVWELDVATGEVRRDPAIERRVGLYSSGHDGLAQWAERLHPDDRGRAMAAFDDLVRGASERFEMEYRIRTGAGDHVWVLGNAVAVERDGDGRARRIVGTLADIDARHRFEEQLGESEQRLRLALEAADLAIWEADLRAGVVRIDARGARRLGRGGEEIEVPIGDMRQLLRHEDVRDLLRSYREHAEGRAERLVAECRARRPDGSTYWVEVYGIATERDAAGRVLRLVGVTADVTRRKEAELRLAHLALQDHLTGLPNRRALDESLEQAVARARRGGESLALMLLDLDGFKRVNDRLGHLTGDKVLAEAARRLRGCVRRSDAVARLGGDEFAVVAVGFGKRSRLQRLAARIVELLGAPLEVDGSVATVGVSVGVAVYPDDGASPVELLGRADAALYDAKRSRSGFRFAAELGGHADVGEAPPAPA